MYVCSPIECVWVMPSAWGRVLNRMGTIQVCVWSSIINDCAYTRLLVCKLLRILRWTGKLLCIGKECWNK